MFFLMMTVFNLELQVWVEIALVLFGMGLGFDRSHF